MKKLFRKHGIVIRFILLTLLCSIMLCSFTACGSEKKNKAQSTYTSTNKESDKEEGFWEDTKEFINNHLILTYILIFIGTIINWIIWNQLVDVEFFTSIMEHYLKKAAICFLIGGVEAIIIMGILRYVFMIVKVLLIIVLIGLGIYAIYYKFGDTIKEKFSTSDNKKAVETSAAFNDMGAGESSIVQNGEEESDNEI